MPPLDPKKATHISNTQRKALLKKTQPQTRSQSHWRRSRDWEGATRTDHHAPGAAPLEDVPVCPVGAVGDGELGGVVGLQVVLGTLGLDPRDYDFPLHVHLQTSKAVTHLSSSASRTLPSCRLSLDLKGRHLRKPMNRLFAVHRWAQTPGLHPGSAPDRLRPALGSRGAPLCESVQYGAPGT